MPKLNLNPKILLAFFLLLLTLKINAQLADTSHNLYGIRQTFQGDVPERFFPLLRGHVCNYKWKDLEVTDNVWNWQSFDKFIDSNLGNVPLMLMMFTKESSPNWLYTEKGVPRVIEYDKYADSIGFAPYFPNPAYKYYFERMIDSVANHLKAYPYYKRKYIGGIQACLSEEGDYIAYRNYGGSDTGVLHVDSAYQLTLKQFRDLFHEFSRHYYDAYQGSNIIVLVNPSSNNAGTKDNFNWVIDSLPGANVKCTTIGKGFQENDEVDKFQWLAPILNSRHHGIYVRASADFSADDITKGLWQERPYQCMFALHCNSVHWGMDWSDQMPPTIMDTFYTPSLQFFNRYAGKKDTANANYAMCAFKEGLDAADSVKFPSATYGAVNRTNVQRYMNIQNAYASKGALLHDTVHLIGDENANLNAMGTNDVGWRIFSSNYERYLHQLDAQANTVGYWNVRAPNDTNSIFGKFARGFDVANNKKNFYIDVDNGFLKNQSIKGDYPVVISITYLDQGQGSWQLFYDSKAKRNKPGFKVSCANSGKWKTASVTLYDPNFGNRATNHSDFYIKSTNSQNVIFALVEMHRPDSTKSDIGFSVSTLQSFDTTCINGITDAQSFLVHGEFLNNSKVTVGPLPGYKFSLIADSNYVDSINFINYQTTIDQTIYVKFNPTAPGNYNGNITVKGGGVSSIVVPVKGYSVNSSPVLSSIVNSISCTNAKDGNIDLTLTGGTGPFTYSWRNLNAFKDSVEDIDSLLASVYTVTVSSYAGCSTSASYTITEPTQVQISFSADSMICAGGTTTVYISASGGTAPYTGTGNFVVAAGGNDYVVSDSHGCTKDQYITVGNGSLHPPGKVQNITSDLADARGVCGGGTYMFKADSVATTNSYLWTLPTGASLVALKPDSSSINVTLPSNFSSGSVVVQARNVCGIGGNKSKTLSLLPARPTPVSGPTTVSPLQQNIPYFTTAVQDLVYTWGVPSGGSVKSGQGTASVLVNWGSVSGNVNVKAANTCGESLPYLLPVTVSGSKLTTSVGSLQFDTICFNAISVSQNFKLTGISLTGANVTIGPVSGFKVSTAKDSVYVDSLILSGYGSSINQNIYVKFYPTTAKSYNVNIPVKGGGASSITVNLKATSVSSSPALSAVITNVSCYNAKNGAIDLSLTGGTAPFSYKWSGAGTYVDTLQDISGLTNTTYSVVVTSYKGCTVTGNYVVTQPDDLQIVFAADSMLCKNSTTTLHISATGGTTPYNGTGNFVVPSGANSYTVTDAHGCSVTKSYNVANGVGVPPAKPVSINFTNADSHGVCEQGAYYFYVDDVPTATSYTWTPPAGCTVTTLNSSGSQINLNVPSGFSGGTLSVVAVNNCGSSTAQTKTLNTLPAKPSAISGPTTVSALQSGLVYSVTNVPGISYLWSLPGTGVITSGQGTSSIIATWGNNSGTINVKAVNSCGQSGGSTLAVTVSSFAKQNIQATIDAATKKISVAPNPTTDITHVTFNAARTFNYTIVVTDELGKLLYHQDGVAFKGNNTVTVNLHNFANGIYILTFIDKNGSAQKIKVIKSK